MNDPDQLPTRSLRKSNAGRPRSARKPKGQLILALLRKPDGATLEELQKATHWQAHSIRGFISGKVGKQLGLKVQSFQREGKRAYAIVADAGENAAT